MWCIRNRRLAVCPQNVLTFVTDSRYMISAFQNCSGFITTEIAVRGDQRFPAYVSQEQSQSMG